MKPPDISRFWKFSLLIGIVFLIGSCGNQCPPGYYDNGNGCVYTPAYGSPYPNGQYPTNSPYPYGNPYGGGYPYQNPYQGGGYPGYGGYYPH